MYMHIHVQGFTYHLEVVKVVVADCLNDLAGSSDLHNEIDAFAPFGNAKGLRVLGKDLHELWKAYEPRVLIAYNNQDSSMFDEIGRCLFICDDQSIMLYLTV